MLSSTQINKKIQELEMACYKYKVKNQFSIYVLYAISDYINRKATTAFLKSFITYPTNNFETLIEKCLKGDTSDAAIVKKVKKIIKVNQ